MSVFGHYATLIMQRCDQLARLSSDKSNINRQYLTPEHAGANNLLRQWMQEAGLICWTDEAANQWGRLRSTEPQAKSLIIGSHIDTVPDAGRYDGVLGVVSAVVLAQYCIDHNIALPFHLDIVAFGDEEGSRFGTTLLGSRAVTGQWQMSWNSQQDANGIDLSGAMRSFGLDINRVENAVLAKERIHGFIELHIEQGPVLEEHKLPVGIVSGIAGAKRLMLSVSGKAGHAGTVPMRMRQDALVAASRMILEINQIARKNKITATVGQLNLTPNAVNVIPGKCDFTLDIRSMDDALRDRTLDDMLQGLQQIANDTGVRLSYKVLHTASAVKCDTSFVDLFEKAVSRAGVKPFQLASGAGHDTMAMATLCPAAMLFLRCQGGLSHHPDEAVSVYDVEVSLSVLFSFLKLYGQTCDSSAASATQV